MFSRTVLEIPVVYEFIKKNKGESIRNNRKQKGEFKKIYNKLYENDWYQN